MKLLAILFSLAVVSCSATQTIPQQNNETFYQNATQDVSMYSDDDELYHMLLATTGANHMMVLPMDGLSGVEWDGLDGCQYCDFTPGQVDCGWSGEGCNLRIRLANDLTGNWFRISKECDGLPIMNTITWGGITRIVLYYDTWVPAP